MNFVIPPKSLILSDADIAERWGVGTGWLPAARGKLELGSYAFDHDLRSERRPPGQNGCSEVSYRVSTPLSM